MFVNDVCSVSDLTNGETAMPEPDMGYELRTIAGDRWEKGTVEFLFRRGDAIFARTTAGEEFAVTGKNAHVLVPLSF